MPDTGTNNNNQQAAPNPANSAIDNLQGLHNSSDPVVQALLKLANAINSNPDTWGRINNPTTTSQSNVAAGSKWKFSRDNPEEAARKASAYKSRGNLLEDFEAGIKDQLLDSLAGGSFKKGIQGALSQFQKEFGFDLRNIGHEAGKALTKKAADAFKNSPLGQEVKKRAGKLGNSLLNTFVKNDATKGALKNVASAFLNGGQAGGQASGFLGQTISQVGGKALATGGGKMVAGKAAAGLASLGPWGLLILGIIITIAKILGPALKGLGEMIKALGKSFNREEELRKKRLEEAKKRLTADVNYITEEPFKILQQAVEKWTSVWDSNIRKVGQTQGYDKEAVYALYEGYADRLRSDDENLAAVISATDIVDNLSKVLDSGLTGKAAEEFAYIATKLNAAIPTQDFFGYVDTYASIAANATSMGMTQTQALKYANQQLEDFASNLLYSSRELAGGFTTGLKNGSELFSDAVKIALAAKTNTAKEISGTLTSVSAIIGAVAPDLAGALVDNVVQAAIGGNNNTSLVALRSLANINAGNTDFLRAMAENPKEVFSTLFSNLAQLQNMSPDNYMEVAEGLAEVFGIDKAAFARVDFNYLAQAIDAMNTNNRSLEQNMNLLVSGQTTTSAEQLKAQEINRVILDEGLAYVIDSEAGRAIQQHMWDEQRAVEMMNATYAVDLQGSALEFLEGIRKTVTTLLNFLNPIGFIAKGVANMTQTISESIGNDQDIKEILKLGAVGSNSKSFYDLTTRGKALNLTTSLVEMLGGQKGIPFLDKYNAILRESSSLISSIATGAMSSDMFNRLNDRRTGYHNPDHQIDWSSPASAIASSIAGWWDDSVETSGVKAKSRYDWGMVGKSFALALRGTTANEGTLGTFIRDLGTSATQLAQEASNKKFAEFLATAKNKDVAGKLTYEEWVATAKGFGIANFDEALENYGRTEEELRSYFEANEAAQGAMVEEERKNNLQGFIEENRAFWDYTSGSNGVFQTAMWIPFFGDGGKYDVRMNAVDTALSNIQSRIGVIDKYTVISGIKAINTKLGEDGKITVLGYLELISRNLKATFVDDNSRFQQCLSDWISYIASKEAYSEGLGKSSAWSDLRRAEDDQQAQSSLALAKALEVFTNTELQNMDPQLQTNVLLGEIVVILQAIMQQNNTQAGGLSLIDTISALGLGVTTKQG